MGLSPSIDETEYRTGGKEPSTKRLSIYTLKLCVVTFVTAFLHTQDEESTSDGGITVVTSQQNIQEYFATKLRHHSRRHEHGSQKKHSLGVNDSSYCDQHMKGKMRTKCSRRRGDGELKESRRQPSETGFVRSNLKCLEGR